MPDQATSIAMPADRALVEDLLDTYRQRLHPGAEHEFIWQQLQAARAMYDMMPGQAPALASHRIAAISQADVARILDELSTDAERDARAEFLRQAES